FLGRDPAPSRFSAMFLHDATASDRKGKFGSYIGPEALFMNHLPSVEAVAEAKDVGHLRQMFGPQHGWTDSWGDGNRTHWTQGWTWFTMELKGRLRYLSVFAHVSSSNRQNPADIDILLVEEGFFRPANPNSAAEREE